MSTEKTNIEKFEDFELTPENAKKVGGGGHIIRFCLDVEIRRCVQVEGKYCGPGPTAVAEIFWPHDPFPTQQ